MPGPWLSVSDGSNLWVVKIWLSTVTHPSICYEMPRKDKSIEKRNHVCWEGEWGVQPMKQKGSLWCNENGLWGYKILKIIEFYTYNENTFDMLLSMSNTCIILRYHVHNTSIKLLKKKQTNACQPFASQFQRFLWWRERYSQVVCSLTFL